MGLIRFLAIAAGIYLLFRLIGRVILPWVARYFVKKTGDRMSEQMKRRSEGEKIYQNEKITIRKTNQPKKQSSSDDDDDEYIDYEEV